MSKLTDFYFNDEPDIEGRYFYEILGQKNHWLEACHDYIQWLFPLPEHSNFNPDAPLLTEEDAIIFTKQSGDQVDQATTRFLNFMGIEITPQGMALAEDIE